MRGSSWAGSGPDGADNNSQSLWVHVPVRRSRSEDAWGGPTEKVFRREIIDRVTAHPAVPSDASATYGGPRWNYHNGASETVPREQRSPLADLRLLIVDDCTLQRENLVAAIAAHGPGRPRAAWDLSSLVTALNDDAPNLVLINLDTRDSAMLVQATFEVRPDIRVIVLGVSEDDETRIVACAEAGVSGYHLRSESIDDLIALIGRVDRRMHNKLFVADNVAAVAGGRNIADEYMVNAEGSNFIDMDTFVAGPAVRELSRAFDLYWNSEHVYPVDQIAFSPLSPEQRRAQFDRLTANTHPPTDTGRVPDDGQVAGSGLDLPFDQLPPALVRMLNLPYDLAEGRLGPLLQAQARVLVDPLSKTEGVNEHEHSITGTVFEGTYQWFTTSRQLLRMTSPYFVPDDTALQSLAHARQQGVRLQLVTNALAATDEPWVHVGYSRQRQALLKMGVEIFEISPSLSAKRRRLGVIGKSLSALHMKSAILDHRQVFLGSMNLDPRSVRLNTELGLIIDSPEMAAQLEAMSDLASVYQLRLAADGQSIEWIERNGEGQETVHSEEPETSPWLRFKLWLLGPLVPLGEL